MSELLIFYIIKKQILSVCLSEAPLTRATLALPRNIIPFWNQDDSRIENLPFCFGAKGPITLQRS